MLIASIIVIGFGATTLATGIVMLIVSLGKKITGND
jgi:hypothetical protein